MEQKYIPVDPQLTIMGEKRTDLTNSDRTHFNQTSLPYGKADERGGVQKLTPYVIRKLWVGEQRKEEVEEEVKEVDMVLISTSKFHQVGLMVRGELWLTVFFHQCWYGCKARV